MSTTLDTPIRPGRPLAPATTIRLLTEAERGLLEAEHEADRP